MTIPLKSPKEIQIIKKGGKKLSQILVKLVKFTKVGTNLLEIENKANELILKAGMQPAFKLVPDYYWATCLNVNDSIVHGIPSDYQLKENDVLSIDIGAYYKGFNTDTCYSFRISKKQKALRLRSGQANVDEIDRFLAVGRHALEEAKKQVKEGNYVGYISQAIQNTIEGAGYNCARSLTGHGVGKDLHESPLIPCFLDKNVTSTPPLFQGMVLAIEIIYMQGSFDLIHNHKDGWTIRTKDGKISAVFEETVAITSNGLVVLTGLPRLSTG